MIGLIAFAGQAVVKCPLTVDYDAFRRSLEELDPASASRGGTAIGDAIRKSLEVFHAKTERDQAILLITDGDDQQSYPLEAAAVAAERHVTIFTVGLGDATQGALASRRERHPSRTSNIRASRCGASWTVRYSRKSRLKTSGVYVPVGTLAYDLGGAVCLNHLHGRSGPHRKPHPDSPGGPVSASCALASGVLADLFTRPYPVVKAAMNQGIAPEPMRVAESRQRSVKEPCPLRRPFYFSARRSLE